MRILVLGGTTEASALAARLAQRPEFSSLLSLAGRTTNPRATPIPTRVGGFGGPIGMATFLREERIHAVLDATHPFAAIMSRNAAQACGLACVPLLALRRGPWRAEPGDRWIDVASMEAAVAALGAAPRAVFLTVGRLELAPFAQAPQHRYFVRTIEPIGNALPVPQVVAIRDRAPFDERTERALMIRERIDCLVTKNSGGAATYPKIAAARALGLPVVMVARPEKPAGVPKTDSVEEAMEWLDALHRVAPQERGV